MPWRRIFPAAHVVLPMTVAHDRRRSEDEKRDRDEQHDREVREVLEDLQRADQELRDIQP